MLYWKPILVPTKLTKLVCVTFITMSVIFELMDEMKYMLHWRNPTNLPIENADGSLLFQTRKCEINKCYLTDRSRLLSDFTSFHVVLHNSPDIQCIEDSRKFSRKKARFIYGRCSYQVHSKSIYMDKYLDMLAKKYFYFPFENAKSDDYVTDIIPHDLHATMPVLYGGANYTRFLPDGSCSNALQYSPEILVCRMFEIMQNSCVHQIFIKRRNDHLHHAHSEYPETPNYRRLCDLVTDEDRYSVDALRVNFTG